MQTYNDILLAILNCIDYQNDKEMFVKEFHALNHLDAMGSLIPQLPKDIQEKIRACGNDPEKMKQLIPEKAYKDEFTRVSLEALKEFLDAVLPTLNALQKEKIANFISSCSNPIPLPL